MKFEVQISGSVTKAFLATLIHLPITQFCFPTTIASRVAATDCNTPQRLTYVLSAPLKIRFANSWFALHCFLLCTYSANIG